MRTHIRTAIIAAATLAIGATGACSSSGSGKVASATQTASQTPSGVPRSTTTPQAATSAPVPATSAPPAPAGPPKLGTTQNLSDEGLVIALTVSGYKARRAGQNAELLPADDRIATITVKACVTHGFSNGDQVGVSWAPWSLVFADGSSVQAVSAYSPTDFPAPLYPNDSQKVVHTGDCRSGLVPFAIPASVSADPVKVVYDAGTGVDVQWGM